MRMSVISRYLGGRFLSVWGLVLTGFIVLYLAIDLMENLGAFLGADLGPGLIFLFFAAQLPKIIGLMNPAAALVAAILALTILARNSEIVAFKAGGVSLWRLGRPLLIAGAGLSLAGFILAETIAPPATAVANKIWEKARRGDQVSTLARDVWLKGIKLIEHLDGYDEADGSAYGLTIIFTGDGTAERLISAPKGRFENGRLILEDALDKTYGPGRTFSLARRDRLELSDWPAPPPGLSRAEQASEEMSFMELRRVVKRLAAEGFGPTRQRVDLQLKLSFAFLPLVMVAAGLPLGFWRERGGSAALAICLGLAVSFLYLIAMELARNLGYAGILPPPAAAWLPNAVFLLFGAWLFSYVRQ